MEDEGDFDTGGADDAPEPEDTTSRSDVEEAVISQKQDRGDPDPHRSDRGYLRGRRLQGVPFWRWPRFAAEGGQAAIIFSLAMEMASRNVCAGVLPKHQRP